MIFAAIMRAKHTADEIARLGQELKDKDFFSSVGGTIGSLAVMGLTGGTVNPFTVALLTGAAQYLGGKIGANQQKINPNKYKYLSEEAEEANKYIDKNIIGSSLRGAVTSGMTQATNLAMTGEKASNIGSLDFDNSLVGKSINQIKTQARRQALMEKGMKLDRAVDASSNFITDASKLPDAESNLEFMMRKDFENAPLGSSLMIDNEMGTYNILPPDKSSGMIDPKFQEAARNDLIEQEIKDNLFEQWQTNNTETIQYDLPWSQVPKEMSFRRPDRVLNLEKVSSPNIINDGSFESKAVSILDRLKDIDMPYYDHDYFNKLSNYYDVIETQNKRNR